MTFTYLILARREARRKLVRAGRENIVRYGGVAVADGIFVGWPNNEHANDRPKIDIGAIRIFLRLGGC